MGLLSWVRTVTQSLPNIAINDFCHSFEDGMVFCGLSNVYNPESVDYYALDPVRCWRCELRVWNCLLASSLANALSRWCSKTSEST